MSEPQSPQQSRSSFRQVLGNAGILLGGKLVNAVASTAALAIAARALGVESLGVLILVHAYMQTVSELSKFQSWQAVILYGTAPLQDGRTADFQQVFRFSLSLDAISAVAGLLIAVGGIWLVGSGLGWPETLRPQMSLYAFIICFLVSATPTGVLRLMDRFDLIAAQSSIESWVRLIGAALAWKYGAGLPSFLLIWFLGQVAAFGFLFAAAAWTLHSRQLLAGFRLRSGRPLAEGMPGIWSFVWSTNFNSSLGTAFTQLGTLMVGALLGAREAALYRIARQVANALAKPAKLVVPALYPELARLAQSGDRHGLRKLVVQLTLAGGSLATGLLLIALLVGKPALGWIMGPEFVAAHPVMLWLLASAVIGIWAVPLEPLLISTGLAAPAFRARLGVTLLYVPLLYLLVASDGDWGGLRGAGLASVLGMALLFLSQFWLVRRWFQRPPGSGPLTPSASAAGYQ